MCVDDFHLFSDSVFSLKKEDSEKRTVKMQMKVILRKTQQGNNLDMQLKDKYETSTHFIPTNVLYMILELQLLLVLLYFMHVVFSNYIQFILFLFSGGEEEEQAGDVR